MGNDIASYSIEEIARLLDGKVHGRGADRYVVAPAPGHSIKDRSFTFKLEPTAPRGALVKSFADDDELAIKDYAFEKIGAPAFEPKSRKTRTAAPNKTKATDHAVDERAARTKAANARATAAINKGSAEFTGQKRKLIARSDYVDADGALLYQKLKYDSEPKYQQQRPDSSGGWIQNLKGVKRILYRLPDLVAHEFATTFICEGEKDADAVAALGLCATSSDGGTWKPDLVEPLRGRDIVIVPDHDEAGTHRAWEVANALQGVANSVRMVTLPGLTADNGNNDVSDWLAKDPENAGRFVDLCLKSPPWTPCPEPPKPNPDRSRRATAADHDDDDDDDDDRPSIQIAAGEIAPMATQAEELLIAAGVPLYQRAGSLSPASCRNR